jgi:hypothetical protein
LKHFFEGLKDWDEKGPTATVPRYTDITRAKFRQLVEQGQPFIIADAGRGLVSYRPFCKFI